MERIKKLLKSSGGMGLRIVKTGIAATLCVVVSYWLMLDTPFFAVSTTVISMGKSIDISIRGGKNRIVGAAIGAAIGAAFAMALQPLGFSHTFPSLSAVTVAASFITHTTPYRLL